MEKLRIKISDSGTFTDLKFIWDTYDNVGSQNPSKEKHIQ